MAKFVEVPDVGEVEFPDEMNDDQIVQAIRGFSPVPAAAEKPPEVPEEAPQPSFVPEGFDRMPPADRSRIAAQAEIDVMEARKALDEWTNISGPPSTSEDLSDPFRKGDLTRDYVNKLQRFNAINEQYYGPRPEVLAAEQAAEKERTRAEFEASGRGPTFMDSAASWIVGKTENLAAGVADTFAPSFPPLADAARNLAAEGAGQQEFSMINRGPAAAIGRGVGDVAMLALGNPTGNALKAITAISMKAANEAYGAALGQSGGDRGAAQEAAQKAYRDTAIYMGLGMGTSRAVQAALPEGISPFRAAILSGTGASGANVGTSFALASARGEEYGLQQLTADLLMGGVEGKQTFSRVKAGQPEVPPKPSIEQPVTKDLAELAPDVGSDVARVVSTAIDLGEGQLVTGDQPAASHSSFTKKAIETNPDIALELADSGSSRRGFIVEEPDGTQRFATRAEAFEIAKGAGQLTAENSKGELNSQDLNPATMEPRPRKLGPGAADIEEPFDNNPVVGAWNAKVDEQRAARGLAPLASEARRADQATWDAAEQKFVENPNFGRDLVDSINDGKKESVSDTEQAAILREMLGLREQRDQATQRAFDEATYSPEERLTFLEEAKAADERLARTEEADRKSGTAQGRALRIRRLMAYEDFTLAGLMGKARRAKGEDLTPEESATLKTKADRFQKAKETFETKVEEAENLPVDDAIRAIETEASKDPAFTPEVKSLADRIVARLEKAAQGASDRIRGLMSQLGSAPDVTVAPKLIKELAILAAADIGRLGIKSTLKFTRWATKMVKEFGEKIKPFLDRAWKEADTAVDEAALGTRAREPREPATPAEKAQKALDAAVVERERVDMMLAGELAPAKKQSREALTQLEEDMRAEVQAMRGLAAEIKSAERPKADPETVRENAQVTALERAAAEYERRLNEADLSGTRRKQGADTLRVAKARALRDAAKKALEAARRLANPPKSKEQAALDKYKKMAARKSAEYQERIDKGDFGPRPKRKPLDLSKDPEAVKAKAEMERVKSEFQKQQFQWEQAQRTRTKKFVDGVKETLAASRSLITSADVSAPFRQGGFLLLGDLVFHPVRAAKQIATMFRQLVSEKGFEEAQAQISLRPNARAGLYDQAGLYLSDLSTKLSAREESMRSNLAEKIPVIGRIVRASNRAYAGFLNRQRADAFDAMVESMGGPAKVTPEEAKAIANFVNTATGRGTSLQMDRAADVLARYFFSPRFLLSRFQLAMGQNVATGQAKRVAAQQYAKFAIGLAAVYGLAKLAGGDVEKDPRSADFGKAKFGNTRIDPMAGLAQISTFLAREITGETKKKGRVEDKNRWDTFVRFGRTKLAPIPGVVADRMAEQRLDMSKPTPYRKNFLKAAGEDVSRLTVPLSYQEIPELYKEHGFVKGTILEVMNLLGAGVQTYDKR